MAPSPDTIGMVPVILAVAAITFTGLLLSNVLYDRFGTQYISRKIGHIFGGLAFLVGILWLTAPVAVALASALSLGLILLRFWQPTVLRGVGGSGRPHAYAELTYPIAGTLSLAIGWLWLGDRWLALVPILFMAFGDSVTGMVRSVVYGREVKGNWGSVAMLTVCLAVGVLYQPYWVSAAGAVTATAAERLSPIARGWVDDNWVIIATSLLAMAQPLLRPTRQKQPRWPGRILRPPEPPNG